MTAAEAFAEMFSSPSDPDDGQAVELSANASLRDRARAVWADMGQDPAEFPDEATDLSQGRGDGTGNTPAAELHAQLLAVLR